MTPFEQRIKQTVIEAARNGGEILLKNLHSKARTVENKAAFDFVTHVDRDSEQAIVQHLKKNYPEYDIFAEERGADVRTGEYQWIIDPLDGTTNYIHGFPFFSVSIALKKQDDIIFGLIYDPLRDETFWALKDHGAFLGETRIQVSAETDMRRALIATGFPFRDKTKIAPYVKSFAKIFDAAAGVRRAGSAALDLAYVACGRAEGFWEIGLNTWDVAAGVLIIAEAGGMVTDFSGNSAYLESGNLVAGNPAIHSYLVSICDDILRDVFMR